LHTQAEICSHSLGSNFSHGYLFMLDQIRNATSY